MPESRRKFDQDFKEGAVRLVRETGRPIAQIAKDLGINAGTLANWVAAERRGNPRSAAERLSWTRESQSSQVSGLPVSRSPANPWTHVRIAFEPVTSKNRRRARNTDFGAAVSSTTGRRSHSKR